MKILCCGDRNWDDESKVRKILAEYHYRYPINIIHGNAKGADRIAAMVAMQLNMGVESFSANWAEHGKAAGPLRNQLMIDAHPDLVIAFHSNIENSRGTADIVKRARLAGIPVRIIG